jgi:hypothetical protein
MRIESTLGSTRIRFRLEPCSRCETAAEKTISEYVEAIVCVYICIGRYHDVVAAVGVSERGPQSRDNRPWLSASHGPRLT